MLEENNYLVCQLPGTAMQTDIQKVQDKYKAIEPDIITDSLSVVNNWTMHQYDEMYNWL